MLPNCPPFDDLRAFSTGRLDLAACEQIAAHVEACRDCQARMETISAAGDTVVSAVRGLSQADIVFDSGEARLLSRIEAIGREPSYLGDAAATVASDDVGTKRDYELLSKLGQAGMGAVYKALYGRLGKFVASEAALENDLGTIRDYRLLAKLGEGGMGAVYKALHTRLGKVVALKVLPADRMTAAAVSRFEREMRAVGKLHHPNIVGAHDAGEHEGRHYLVMELVEGADLSQLSRRCGPLAPADACEIVRQTAAGLQHAHEHGLVHRDIKPSNLMLTPAGQVKILDLGLALLNEPAADPGGEISSAAQMMGTADYVAPEQVGDSHNVDIKADIYSLGCTLYKLLTGNAPFSGPEFNTPVKKMLAHVGRPAPAIHERRPDLSEPLVAVLDRMLAKAPSDRYARPADVATAIVPYCAGADLAALAERDRLQRDMETPDQRPNGFAPTHTAKGTDVAALSALTDTARSTPPPAPGLRAPASRRRPPRKRLLVALAAAAMILLAGFIVRLKTRDGTLVLTVNDPDAIVTIDGEQVEVTRSGDGKKLTISVEPGTHTLSVTTAEGLTFKIQDSFELSANDHFELTATLVRPAATSTVADQTAPWDGWPADAPKPAIAPFDADQAAEYQQAWADHLGLPIEYENLIGMKFRLIPPAEFLMGSSAEDMAGALAHLPPERSRWSTNIESEGPQHRAILTQPVYLGMHEVTQGDYQSVMGANPSLFSNAGTQAGHAASVANLDTTSHPVDNVSWNDAAEFCARLSKLENYEPFYERSGETIAELEGTGYRLPTEAEWEFVCRAGTTTKYITPEDGKDLPVFGWLQQNSGGRTHPVGQLAPNPFGLFDLIGNVWEWVHDRWAIDYYQQFASAPAIDPKGAEPGNMLRVNRGGNWFNNECRSANRGRQAPTNRSANTGFRVALTVDAVRQALEATPIVDATRDAQPAGHDPFEPGPDANLLPGILARPALLPGFHRWQVTTRAPRDSVAKVAWIGVGEIACLAAAELRTYDAETLDLLSCVDVPGDLTTVLMYGTGILEVAQGASTPAPQGMDWPTISPNGELIAGAARKSDELPRTLKVTARDGRVVYWSDGPEETAAFIPFVVWSSDSTGLCTSPNRRTVSITWLDGRPAVLFDPSGFVNSIAWSPDGQWIATAHDDGVRLWQPDGTAASHIPFPYSRALAWHPDSRRIAVGGVSAVAIYSNDGQRIAELVNAGSPEIAHSLAWNQEGTELVSGGPRGLCIWRENGSLARSLPTSWYSDRRRSGTAWSQHGRLATTDSDGIRVWHVDGGLPRLSTVLDGPVDGDLAFSPDGRLLVSSTWNASPTVRLWLFDGGSPIDLEGVDAVDDVCWTPDGLRFTVAGRGFWATYSADGRRLAGGTAAGKVGGIAWDPTGTWLVVAADEDVRLYGSDGTPPTAFPLESEWGTGTRVAWHPQRPVFAVRFSDGVVRIGDVEGKWVDEWRPDTSNSRVQDLAWSPDGRWLAIGSDYGEGALSVLRDGGHSGPTLFFSQPGAAVGSRTCAWGPDGRVVVSTPDRAFVCWEPEINTVHWIAQHLPPRAGDQGRQIAPASAVLFTEGGRLLWGDPDAVEHGLRYLVEGAPLGESEILRPSQFQERLRANLAEPPVAERSYPLDQPVDLLAIAEPVISAEPRDAVSLVIPRFLDGDYDVELVAVPPAELDYFALGLVVERRPIELMLAFGGDRQGLDLVDGYRFWDPFNPTFFGGNWFPPGEERLVVCRVRGGNVTVDIGDERVVDFTGDAARLTTDPSKSGGPLLPVISLRHTAGWQVKSLTLTPRDRGIHPPDGFSPTDRRLIRRLMDLRTVLTFNDDPNQQFEYSTPLPEGDFVVTGFSNTGWNVPAWLMSDLARLPYLKQLSLRGYGGASSMSLEAVDLRPIGSLSRLRHMTFAHVDVSSAELAAIGPLSQLERLDLLECHNLELTDEMLDWFDGHENLRYIAFAKLKSTDDQILAFFGRPGAARLTQMDLMSPPLSDRILEGLAKLEGLRVLDLSGNPLTEAAVEALRTKMPNCTIHWSPPAASE